MNNLIKALNFASIKRVPNKPISYVDDVVQMLHHLVECGVNNETLFCGLVLHKTIIEETTTTNQLYNFFDDTVAALVTEYTNYTYKRIELPKCSDNMKLMVLALNYHKLKNKLITSIPLVPTKTEQMHYEMIFKVTSGINESLDKRANTLLCKIFELNLS
jgi:(p)ppGpp synthase/HD superfamily hydrolase